MEVDLIRAVPHGVEVSKAGDGRYTFRGVASTIGEPDRMRRVFLPGAFDAATKKVPLFYLHDETGTIGSSAFTLRGGQLLHDSSLNLAASRANEVKALIEGGDMPATSIGWLSEHVFHGWTQLKRQAPELATRAAAHGVPQAEDLTYYADAEIVENSVVPIPANRNALISMASLLSKEKGMLEGMLELAAGARHNAADQAAIQRAHDALKEVGAQCADDAITEPLAPGAPEPGSNLDETGISGGWRDHMRSALESIQSGQDAQQMIQTASYALSLLEAASKPAHKYQMPDGSYPIDACTGENSVESAAKLAHHSKTYSFEEVKAHVLKAKRGLNCSDEVLPESWSEEGSQEKAAAQPAGGDPQSAPPLTNHEIEALDRELAALIQS